MLEALNQKNISVSYSKELQLENLGDPSVFMTPLQRVSNHSNRIS